jgi:hypothetical protein
MYGNKRSGIVRFVIQETGTYEDQFRRPYQTHLDGQTQNELINALDGAKAITPSKIAGIANQFIRPSATPESQIGIVNGWECKRLRFFLEIQTEDFIGNVTSEYVVGYTDHPGISFGGHLDPNMVFFINAINTTRTTKVVTPLGNQTHHNLIDASHVLVDSSYQGIMSKQNKTYGLRPEDVFNKMEFTDVMNQMSDTDMMIDTVGTITTNAVKSKRANSIVPVYASSMLDSYLQTRRTESFSDVSQIRTNAAAVVESDSVARDPFMSFMRGRNHLGATNTFTMGDLMDYDKNVSYVTTVVPVSNGYNSNLHQRGMTASWGGSDYTTLFATMLSQSVPSYMLQYSINKIHFFSTNMDIGGNITTRVANVKSFTDGDISQHIQTFIFRLENELLKGLSHNNQTAYQLEMICDLLGETWIKLSINNEPMVDYVCPSFCDSLMVPVVTQNENTVISIASDFDNIMTSIGDSVYNPNGSAMMSTGYSPAI